MITEEEDGNGESVFNDLSDFPPGYGSNTLVMLVKMLQMLHYVDLYKSNF